MSSRIDILSAIAKNKPAFKPLPEILSEAENSINLVERFTENAIFVGAKVNQVYTLDEIADYIQHNFKGSGRILTNNSVFEKLSTLDQTTTLPHELENVDLAILDAHFGVAENGAIWVTEALLVQRVLPFITQHLILIIKDVLPSMLDAYAKINYNSYVYGFLIAGPSKTADIEQSLVIGAHGARSLSIFILAEPA